MGRTSISPGILSLELLGSYTLEHSAIGVEATTIIITISIRSVAIYICCFFVLCEVLRYASIAK